MFRNAFLLISLVLLMMFQTVQSEESANNSGDGAESSSSDSRQLISMPDQVRKLMREEMLSHLATLNELIGYLAANNLDAAAEAAESKLGMSSMGKHRDTGMGPGPGRFMPPEMRNIGRGMHNAATEFSQVAKKGDLNSAYGALQKVTGFCVACHYSYRTKQ